MNKILVTIIILLALVGISVCLITYICEDDWCFVFPWQKTSVSEIPETWKLHTNDSVGFSIQYDPTLTLQEDSKNDLRFYKWGPTQRGQTEMYDGIIFSIRKIDVTDGGQSYIDNQIEQFKNVGTITEPLRDGNLNGIPTKEYSASGLGDFKIIFILINNRSLIEISYMVPDPTNAGFQKTIDMMLSTFKLKQ